MTVLVLHMVTRMEDDVEASGAQQRPSSGVAAAAAKVGEDGNISSGTSAVALANHSDPPTCEVHSAADVVYVGDVEHNGYSTANGDMDALVEDGVEPLTTQQDPSSGAAAGAAEEGEDGKTSTRPSNIVSGMKMKPRDRKAAAVRSSSYTNLIWGRGISRPGRRRETYSRREGEARYLPSHSVATTKDEIVDVVPIAAVSPNGSSISHTQLTTSRR